MRKILILLLLLRVCAFGACPVIPTQPSCPAGATSLPNNGSLTANTTYRLSAATQTITSSITSATNTNIYVCPGDSLTIPGNISSSGLTIHVLTGGKLRFSNATNASILAAVKVIVYGKLYVTNRLTLNSNAEVYIASTGTMVAQTLNQTSGSTFAT